MRRRQCLTAILLALSSWLACPTISRADVADDRYIELNASDRSLNEMAAQVYQKWNAHGHPTVYLMVPSAYSKNNNVIVLIGRIKAALVAQHMMQQVLDARYYRPDQADPGTTPEQLRAIELVMIDQTNAVHRIERLSTQEFPQVPEAANQSALNSAAEKIADPTIGALRADPCTSKSGQDKITCEGNRMLQDKAMSDIVHGRGP